MERPVDLIARSERPADTAAIATAIADHVGPGDVLVLGGDLGAGKTTFTKAFGAALGIEEPITSPTFTLAQEYHDGRLVLHHLDVYRIDHLDEVAGLALPELCDSGGVVVIEWGDKIIAALPPSYLLVRFVFADHDDERQLHLTSVGMAWSARTRALRDALSDHLIDRQNV